MKFLKIIRSSIKWTFFLLLSTAFSVLLIVGVTARFVEPTPTVTITLLAISLITGSTITAWTATRKQKLEPAKKPNVPTSTINEIEQNLFHHPQQTPSHISRQDILEQYKTSVDSLNQTNTQKTTATNYLILLNIAALAFYEIEATALNTLTTLVPTIALATVIPWWLTIETFQEATKAKLEVIKRIEKYLPVSTLTTESHIIERATGLHIHTAVSERTIAAIFASIHLIVLLSAISKIYINSQ